jgi:3-dehydroquinate dehydratase-2
VAQVPRNLAISPRLRHARDAIAGDAACPDALPGTRFVPTQILILNGPNLNLLGQRQPEIYGRASLEDVARSAAALGATLGLSVELRQTNHEGAFIDWIHAARGSAAGLIVNPGGWTHTSVAILDALQAFEGPVIEVHISNIHRREAFRHHSYVSLRADAVIAGCGVEGYDLALRRLATVLGAAP